MREWRINMANTNAVKDPKNGVVSCWVCTGVLIFADVFRIMMLGTKHNIADWIFIILIMIWIIISIVETVKYRKEKNKKMRGE